MANHLHASDLKAYLEHVCDSLDRGAKVHPWRRFQRRWAGIPVAVGLSLTLPGCGGTAEESVSRECTGDQCVGLCQDQVDNDGDGDIDCADQDCQSVCGIGQPDYAAPMPEYCDDGVDNDGDGAIDCQDDECADFMGCNGDDYGIPYESECADGVDNDGDHAVDCADQDCMDDPACAAVPLYAMPF